jgi:hypothetical protein
VSTLTLTILVGLLTFGSVVAIGIAVTRRTAQAQRGAAPAQPPPIGAASAPVYVPASNGAAAGTQRPAADPLPRGKITWPSMIDESIGDLQLDERKALILRLAVVNDEWTLPILRRAVQEEDDAQLLDAIVDALIARRPA